MAISYRLFDLRKDDIQELFSLFSKTYGDSSGFETRLKWEYMQNPRSKEIKIFVAEENGKLAGSTTRLPVDILLEGEIINGAFSVDSMVHPDFRRRGIMKNLYKMSAEIIPVLLSKGTNPGMYNLLMSFGYKPVLPNTYMTTILSPVRWFWWRLKIYKPNRILSNLNLNAYEDFQSVEKFSQEFDDFWKRVAPFYPGIVMRDSAYMNWRYIDIPHRSYTVLYRMRQQKIISMVVLGGTGASGKIVDIIWDPKEKSEPTYTIKFAKRYFRKRGFIKLSFWGTLARVRESLKQNFFFDRGETPRFSVYTSPDKIDRFADGNNIHFVEGDGDSEYL